MHLKGRIVHCLGVEETIILEQAWSRRNEYRSTGTKMDAPAT